MAVVTTAEVKTHLNITAATHDAELGEFIDRAEAVIAQRCGPLSEVAKMTRVRGGGPSLVLPVCPATLLVSVLADGETALTVDDLYLDEVSGVVTYN